MGIRSPVPSVTISSSIAARNRSAAIGALSRSVLVSAMTNSSAPTRSNVAFAEVLDEERSQPREDASARRMTALIVDVLEVIDVEHHHRERISMTRRARDLVRHRCCKRSPIHQPGKAIGRRKPLRLFDERRDSNRTTKLALDDFCLQSRFVFMPQRRRTREPRDGNAIEVNVDRYRLRPFSERDLGEVIFADGLSTKGEVTESSGRGVGLGAAREECVTLGGSVSIQTERGVGTCFRFYFPESAMVDAEDLDIQTAKARSRAPPSDAASYHPLFYGTLSVGGKGMVPAATRVALPSNTVSDEIATVIGSPVPSPSTSDEPRST